MRTLILLAFALLVGAAHAQTEEDAVNTSPFSGILSFCDFPHDIFGDNNQGESGSWDNVLDCLKNYPSCVDLSTQDDDLLQCFADTNTTTDNDECFANIMDCVQNSKPIFDPFYTLPSCVVESGLELTQCFLSNVDTCAASCVSSEWTFPLQDLNPLTLLTCAGFTDNVIDPLCQTLSCCEPCVDAWEGFSSCLLSNVLQMPCESGCKAKEGEPSQRQLYSRVANEAAVSVPESMARDLQEKYKCNICGCDDCTFADPVGVVNFVYDNKRERRPCQQLQQEVENPTIYNTTYCHDAIWRAAFEPCLCYNTKFPDILLSEIPGYGDRNYGNSGTLQDDETEGEKELGDGNVDLDLEGAILIFSACLDDFEGGVADWITFSKCVFQTVNSIYMDTESVVVGNETNNSTTTDTATVPPTVSPPSNETEIAGSQTGVPTESPTNSSQVTKTQPPTYSPTASPVNTTVEFPTSSPTNSSIPGNVSETLPPSHAPTTSPTKVSDTALPTSAPLGGSTSTQTFEFSDLSMRLQGGKPLNAESRAAFETATEDFYRNTFRNANSVGGRHLQDVEFSSFDTDVKVTGESVDVTGNTVTYDQSVTFASTTGPIGEEITREIILEPLYDEEKQSDFIQLLQENDADFESVTDAETQSRSNRSSESDESDKGFLIIIIAAAAGLVCCCCAGGACYRFYSRQSQQSNFKSEDINEPDNGYMVPEGPLPKSSSEAFVDDGHIFDDFRKKDGDQNADGFDQDSESGSGSESSGSEDEDSGSEASEERSGGSLI